MTETEDKINQILKDQYNNFKGRRVAPLATVHSLLRSAIGDDKYLEFIAKDQKENPRPVYSSFFELKNIP